MIVDRHAVVPDLFHYCCSHRQAAIAVTGHLLPTARMLSREKLRQLRLAAPSAGFVSQLVWMTTIDDITDENRNAVGLTNEISQCDRTEYRFTVVPGQEIEPWTRLRHHWPRHVVVELESLPGTRPDTWWVSGAPVDVYPTPALLLGAGVAR